jgi:hypothetical protein
VLGFCVANSGSRNDRQPVLEDRLVLDLDIVFVVVDLDIDIGEKDSAIPTETHSKIVWRQERER